MNRKERRETAKNDMKVRLAMWPGGLCEVPQNIGIPDGEKFTISGVRRDKDGTFKHCKPGDETVFTAQQT